MVDVVADEHGPPEAPLSGNEVDLLLRSLEHQRATLALRECAGLDDERSAAAGAAAQVTKGVRLV